MQEESKIEGIKKSVGLFCPKIFQKNKELRTNVIRMEGGFHRFR